MTVEALLPFPVLAPRPPKTFRVTMADASTRTVAAHGFNIVGGALVLLLPAGCAAAFAPATWLEVAIEETTDA